VDELVKAVRTRLAVAGDPAKAPQMRAHMKSEIPFRGVPKPVRNTVLQGLFAQYPLPDREAFVRAVRELWREAAFREERYSAIDLTGHRGYAQWQDSDLLPLYEELIVTGAWWDHVDEIAVRRIGLLHRSEPPVLGPVLRGWALDADHGGGVPRSSARSAPKTRGSHTADLRDRSQHRRARFLSAQGDRLGAAPVLANRSGLGAGLRRRPPRSVLAVGPGSAQVRARRRPRTHAWGARARGL
jgi:DNA alkylation repair enzyme